MEQAYFVKYVKNLNMESALKKVIRIKKQSNTPIEYMTIAEINCTLDQMKKIIESGSISKVSDNAFLGIQSTQNNKGIWKCIKLNEGEIVLIVFTGGTANILYYSFLP